VGSTTIHVVYWIARKQQPKTSSSCRTFDASSWRIKLAHQAGASSWRIKLAHQAGASSWRIKLAHQAVFLGVCSLGWAATFPHQRSKHVEIDLRVRRNRPTTLFRTRRTAFFLRESRERKHFSLSETRVAATQERHQGGV
jgi:hypothetical protein